MVASSNMLSKAVQEVINQRKSLQLEAGMAECLCRHPNDRSRWLLVSIATMRDERGY